MGGRRNDSTRVSVLRDFESYLAALKERLGIGPAEAQEVIDELECHLLDKASDLESQGVSLGEARELAMEHLGDPEDISRRMRLVYGYAGWRDILLAVAPHLMMASLFLVNACCNYFLIAIFLGIVTCVSWMKLAPRQPQQVVIFMAGLCRGRTGGVPGSSNPRRRVRRLVTGGAAEHPDI